jgi:outer membrane protein OmpA-like peptidoglycan-associated protein
MKKFMIALAFIGLGTVAANAQITIETPSKYKVATNSFWSNWYVQVGADMTVQNPAGNKFADQWHDGRSYGLNLAVGKWFSPEIGGRLKLNWENGLLEREHNHATLPSYDAGGYAGLYYENLFNMSNIFCGYNENRVWNVSVYPRMGFIRNFDDNRYAPALGAGLSSTWKLSNLLNLYLDASYTITDEDFNGVIDGGSKRSEFFNNYNGFMTVEVGAQFNLGTSTWEKAISVAAYNALAASSEEALSKLRSDLDRERQVNADLRSQLARAPKTEAKVEKVIASAKSSVFFAINSSKIVSKKDLINIEAIASAAKDADCKVVVTGAADSKTGSSAYNQKLSEARAQAVADELVNLGVSRDKIEVRAVGGVNEVSPYTLNRRAIVELK